MIRTKKSREIVAVSQNAALLALFTGYGLGRNINVKTFSRLGDTSVPSGRINCCLLILDCRPETACLTDEVEHLLPALEALSHIPVLFIYDKKKPDIPAFIDHFHFFTKTQILSDPDTSLSRFIDDARHYERRSQDRRLQPDRRGTSQFERRLQNHNRISHNTDTLHAGPYTINFQTKTVLYEGDDLHLTLKEFELFSLLIEEKNKVCPAESILEQLWPDTSRAGKSDLYQYMHTLRKKVDRAPGEPQRIVTIKGVGYQLRL